MRQRFGKKSLFGHSALLLICLSAVLLVRHHQHRPCVQTCRHAANTPRDIRPLSGPGFQQFLAKTRTNPLPRKGCAANWRARYVKSAIRAKPGLATVPNPPARLWATSGCNSGVDAQAIIFFCSHCKGLISYPVNSRKNARLVGRRVNNGTPIFT